MPSTEVIWHEIIDFHLKAFYLALLLLIDLLTMLCGSHWPTRPDQ